MPMNDHIHNEMWEPTDVPGMEMFVCQEPNCDHVRYVVADHDGG